MEKIINIFYEIVITFLIISCSMLTVFFIIDNTCPNVFEYKYLNNIKNATYYYGDNIYIDKNISRYNESVEQLYIYISKIEPLFKIYEECNGSILLTSNLPEDSVKYLQSSVESSTCGFFYSSKVYDVNLNNYNVLYYIFILDAENSGLILLHEFGHFIDNYYDISTTDVWINLYNEYKDSIDYSDIGDENHLKSCPSEFFAAMFLEYIEKPDTLKTISVDIYNIIDSYYYKIIEEVEKNE